MTLDVARLRAETPGTEHVVHLNNAGAALMPTPVIDAVRAHLDAEARIGGYEAKEAHARDIEAVYSSLAALLHADRDELALEDNATRAWDFAFYGMNLGEGDRILTTTTEYVSNWAAYMHARDRMGIVVEVVPDTPDGEIDLEALQSAIDASVKLITLNHVPTNCGLVNPAEQVGRIAREHGVPFLLDACQSVGQLPIDVEEIGCDMLSATSRKFLRGPRGVGFLYVRKDFIPRLDPAFVELETGLVSTDGVALHRTAQRFETWEKSYANVLGLGAAVDYALGIGIEPLWDRIRLLGAQAREQLSEVPGVTIRDIGRVLGGIVTFEVAGLPAATVRDRLLADGINVSISTRNSSPVDMQRRDIDSVVRASVHAYNTEQEIGRLVGAVDAMRGT